MLKMFKKNIFLYLFRLDLHDQKSVSLSPEEQVANKCILFYVVSVCPALNGILR